MSYEEGSKGNSFYPRSSSALITPPKDPKEQPLIAANPVPSSGSTLTPSYRNDEPFTPISTSAESGDFEPLPYTYNIFDAQLSPPDGLNNHLWQHLASPLQSTTLTVEYSPLPTTSLSEGKDGTEIKDDNEKQIEGNHPPLPALDEVHSAHDKTSSKKERSHNKDIAPQVHNGKVNDGEEKPPPFPHNHWPMYHPPPYYWMHGYHYGYPHHYGAHEEQRKSRSRLSHPNLFPKPQNGHYHHHAYPSAMPYGHYGRPPFIAGHPEPSPGPLITNVTNNDVICGRGGAVNNHPGNRRFRQFIQDYKHQYLNESKQRKPFVAMRVLEAVKNSKPPGRFLVKYPGGYLECGDDRAREKASQALREGAAKLRKQGYGPKPGSSETPVLDNEATQKRGLQVEKIMLPNERQPDESYCDDPKYSSDFDPPRKKIKQEPV